MSEHPLSAALLIAAVLVAGAGKGPAQATPVRTDSGDVAGFADSGIRVFEGIPFAEPPLGDLRWKPPVPVKSWSGVLNAKAFGPRCMQGHEYNDMVFRDPGLSEDCLTLNVWTPAKSAEAKLPVMVWIYGGGFRAGASSEPRYDGRHLAEKGIVVVSMNYRLGVFGFFSHPELTAESAHHSSGNYGLMDQALALDWVSRNIGAFGGDPGAITVAGESAGSFSVSALMASPLSRGLIRRAIGESGAFFNSSAGTLGTKTLGETEKQGTEFAASLGANSLATLRAKPAAEILKAALNGLQKEFRPNIDGYFSPLSVPEIFREGKQAHIPLLAGWNKDEAKAFVLLAKEKPTALSFMGEAQKTYGSRAGEFLALYPAETDQQAVASAGELADAQFIGYATWAWLQAQLTTSNSPVYRYSFDIARPVPEDQPSPGAVHASEIEYVFGTLDAWKMPARPQDRKVSEAMGAYWSNFVKHGDPNGGGVPGWPKYQTGSFQVLHLDQTIRAAPDNERARYEFLSRYAPFSADRR